MSRNGESFHLIPSLNGELYQFDGNSIEKFPMTAEALLSSSVRITDNAVFVGGKDIGNYGVDVATGHVSGSLAFLLLLFVCLFVCFVRIYQRKCYI
jgi:translation initiation factor 2-alpha kinase 3